jgi:hypothetical protein
MASNGNGKVTPGRERARLVERVRALRQKIGIPTHPCLLEVTELLDDVAVALAAHRRLRDGLTAAGIVCWAESLDGAVSQMLAWLSPGGTCCLGPREHGYCTRPACVARREKYAAEWATQAAHAAHLLMALAGAANARDAGFEAGRRAGLEVAAKLHKMGRDEWVAAAMREADDLLEVVDGLLARPARSEGGQDVR